MFKKTSKLTKYHTGLITLSNEPEKPPPYKGAGWHACLSRSYDQRIYHGREVLIYATSWETAQRALNLINASLYLYRGIPPIFDTHLMAHNKMEPDFVDPHMRNLYLQRSLSITDIPIACAIATKASRNRKWVYGITKYYFSINTHSQFWVDLEPGSPHLGVSSFPDDHVVFSHAIVAAYSVLEDIGLELRASGNRPSRIKGKWNPVVRKDLEERLRKVGVNLNEPLLWTVRGSARMLERRRGIPYIAKASWAGGQVRDCDLEVVDAIAYADWLRDCVASHNVKVLTRVLSPYDVINVQHLARRLLLESLGFWRYFQK